MNRTEKSAVVEAMNKDFQDGGIVVLTHYKGLTVSEMSDLRAKMREQGASYRVSKNTLARIAVDGTPYENIKDMLKGPTGIAVSNDPIGAAKAAYQFAKDNEKLVILGGALGEQVLDAAGVEQMAKLPSLDETRGKLVGILVAPAQKLAQVAQAPASQLARVVGAYADKGE